MYSDAYRLRRLVKCYICGKPGGAFYIAKTDRFGITHESNGSDCKHYVGPRTVKDKLTMLREQVILGNVLLDDADPFYTQDRHNRLIANYNRERNKGSRHISQYTLDVQQHTSG